MHALLVADLEGITGLYDINDIEKNKKLYSQEIEIYVKTLKKLGVHQVTVCDAHNQGDILDNKALIAYGANLISQTWNVPHNINYDFAILTGLHGMNGNGGVFPHTFRPDIKRAIIDGVGVGEVEIYCRWLGSMQTPTILIAGDTNAVYEGNLFNIYRHTCCVKRKYSDDSKNIASLYKKIEISIEAALKMDKSKCISSDNEPVYIEIDGVEAYDKFNVKDYNKERLMKFENCSDLVSRLPSLANGLNEIRKQVWVENMEFIKNLKVIIGNLPKESVTDNHIKELLRKIPMQLTYDEREEILFYFQQISDN